MSLWEITVKGEPVEVDFDMGRMTLKESIRLEDALGADMFERITESKEIPTSPRVIQALVWAKLVTQFPDLGLEDFDLDLSGVPTDAFNEGAVVIPMKVGDEEIEAEVQVGGGKG